MYEFFVRTSFWQLFSSYMYVMCSTFVRKTHAYKVDEIECRFPPLLVHNNKTANAESSQGSSQLRKFWCFLRTFCYPVVNFINILRANFLLLFSTYVLAKKALSYKNTPKMLIKLSPVFICYIAYF